ncbi:MAG: exodeoxyribonuclease VII small subunit [Tenericutes bacterium GWF2_57_13]|nr:MAG: exodeoxyribonuclease VII small subunit [Tenericutes bacterium GWF2_57_13]
MAQEKELKFEESLKKLETLVRELEQGELPLETAVAKYNEGIVLAKRCHDLLKQAEAVVVKIADGDTLQDFPKQQE